jgi:ABC-2 type transport system permease protein
VPVDAMPGWFRPITEYQPFTPAVETLRDLLLGTEIGHNGWLAMAWCVGPAALGCLSSRSLLDRDPTESTAAASSTAEAGRVSGCG